MQSTLNNGLGIIHSNHLETLADAYISWCKKTPLAPLEQETVLVQSGGMGDWLKLRQTQSTGISASVRYLRPSRFLWELYQKVCPNTQSQYYQASNLQWRIYRLLPSLCQQVEFARPRHFLYQQESLQQAKLLQLSQKLAELFEQYLLYRSDWLAAWENQQNLFPNQEDESWQKILWQSLVAEIGGPSDAQLPLLFKKNLANHAHLLPRRIILFGINSLPKSVLDTLYLLVPYCQVMLFVLQPCKEFWLDGASKSEPNINHPLLDSLGARGRDFIRLLNQQYENELNEELKLAIWQAEAFLQQPQNLPESTLLQQIQNAILNNQIASEKQNFPADQEPGLYFYPAFSRQREVEVLYDKLLQLFANDNQLAYHDVVVMLPDINQYSAHIHAVFDLANKQQKKHLDYSISDQNLITDKRFYHALEYLLHLPDKRLSQSELIALLEQESIQARLGISNQDLQQIKQWLTQSYIRWGIDDNHKAQILEQPSSPEWKNNTWQYGIDALLAGYCAGSQAIWPEQKFFLDEVSANQGVLLGKLSAFIDALKHFRQCLQQAYTAEQWQLLLQSLLETFFLAKTAEQQELIEQSLHALKLCIDDIKSAQLLEALPLAAIRKGFLDHLNHSGNRLNLRFNGILFCTLTPMRALPFKHIFLLGMNDGDYPREQINPDFDLMQSAKQTRVGDLDRRLDDQYLFLEALLSARQSLHISWLGKSINDGELRTPCNLVSQLQVYLDNHWQIGSDKPSKVLSHDYPLALFSEEYFLETEKQKPWHKTYASQWQALYLTQAKKPLGFHASVSLSEIRLEQLIQFLRQPIDSFFQQTLQVYFKNLEHSSEDDEPFEVDNLTQWQLRHSLLEDNSAQMRQQLVYSGQLPSGIFAQSAIESAEAEANNIIQRSQEHIKDNQKATAFICQCRLDLGTQSYPLLGKINCLYQKGNQGVALIQTIAGKLDNEKKQIRQLVPLRLQQLLLATSGISVPAHLIALDRQYQLAAIDPAIAKNTLEALARHYQKALAAPLPIGAASAWAYIKNQDEPEKALATSQKAFNQHDLENHNVKRAIKNFEDIWQSDGQNFKQLAHALYQDLYQALQEAKTSDP